MDTPRSGIGIDKGPSVPCRIADKEQDKRQALEAGFDHNFLFE
jgi:hypothetical protein